MVKQQIGEEYFPKLAEEPYFVDFLRDAPEPTGEEDEDADFEAPKIYEEVKIGIHISLFVQLAQACPKLFRTSPN